MWTWSSKSSSSSRNVFQFPDSAVARPAKAFEPEPEARGAGPREAGRIVLDVYGSEAALKPEEAPAWGICHALAPLVWDLLYRLWAIKNPCGLKLNQCFPAKPKQGITFPFHKNIVNNRLT